MMLKVDSWYQASIQAFAADSSNVLFLIPGWRVMRDLQEQGAPGPPPGTVFAELSATEPGFQSIEADGPVPLDLTSGRMLALALAAMVDLAASDAAPDIEIRGKLRLPGNLKGEYRAVRASGRDDGRFVPMMAVVRHDLFQEADGTVSLMNLSWPNYRALFARSQLRVESAEPFEDRGESIPVVVVSGPMKDAWSIADKLHATAPKGLLFGDVDDELSLVIVGLKGAYVVLTTNEERDGVLTWWDAGIRGSDGASALMVVDSTPDPANLEAWLQGNVLAAFEFGRQEAS